MRRTSRSTLFILATILAFVLFFLTLDESQGYLSLSLNHFNWLQVIISLAIVFLVGMAFSKEKRSKIWY